MPTLYKLTGAGNNFLVVDTRVSDPFAGKNRKQLARELCNPHTSIGADGLLFLENGSETDLRWDFYNADGSAAEMCGNAARCVALYENIKHNKTEMRIETGAGIVSAKVYSSEEISIEMPAIKNFAPGQKAKALEFDFVNSGVPHVVIKEKLTSVDKLADTVDKIRMLASFKKSGTNVTFFSQKSKGKKAISSLTFERGVAGFTQACGTGVVAAAVSFLKNKPGIVQVEVPGGILKVELGGKRPILTGPAKWIAEINLK